MRTEFLDRDHLLQTHTAEHLQLRKWQLSGF